jgi:hypothetical protein
VPGLGRKTTVHAAATMRFHREYKETMLHANRFDAR